MSSDNSDLKEQFLVSIIIPTFNHGRFIAKCVSLVLNQTYQNFEIIIINNNSSDDTLQILGSFNDPRIKIINIDNGGIIAKSRNAGIEKSQGLYLAFLDSDDFWHPAKLEKSVAYIENSSCDGIFHAINFFDDKKSNATIRRSRIAKPTAEYLLTQNNPIGTSTVVVRAEVIKNLGGFSEQAHFVTAEDYHLWISLIENGARLHYLDEALTNVLIHSSGQSRSIERNVEAIRSVAEGFLKSHKVQGLGGQFFFRKVQSFIEFVAARAFQKQGFYVKSLKHAMNALYWNPLNLKALVVALLNTFYISTRKA